MLSPITKTKVWGSVKGLGKVARHTESGSRGLIVESYEKRCCARNFELVAVVVTTNTALAGHARIHATPGTMNATTALPRRNTKYRTRLRFAVGAHRCRR